MSEIDKVRPRITKIASVDPRHLGQMPISAASVIPCEDCPASDACKSVNNFRKTCPPSQKQMTLNPYDDNKCTVGTNLLLYRMVELMEKGRSSLQ